MIIYFCPVASLVLPSGNVCDTIAYIFFYISIKIIRGYKKLFVCWDFFVRERHKASKNGIQGCMKCKNVFSTSIRRRFCVRVTNVCKYVCELYVNCQHTVQGLFWPYILQYCIALFWFGPFKKWVLIIFLSLLF